MPKRAISVRLDADNLAWLKRRARSNRAQSVSELLNRLVTEARTSGSLKASRSVVGTVTIDPSDPLLARADQAVREWFAASLNRPFGIGERPAVRRTRKSPRTN